ncbi:oxysterol-binding protein-related protein 6-like isoform X2 [Cimex lectularius]|uniref:PH domain-containing protein n=1 Tax=Cimex lectularius TaxID=79782 RepID=A0A8I6TKI6_CIMLE|nr:oxysterol-binding protein-related protein 6-like isoform X2 [Cimex lectularius]
MSKGSEEAKKGQATDNKKPGGYHSDSDASGESLSLSQESTTEVVTTRQNLPTSNQKRVNRRSSEWEIIEGLRDGQRYETKPDVFTGYLHKKRKWPLKGWHKRYFVLDTGLLKYGKSPNDVSRGKIHGSVDIALSVISTKSKRKRIDIDAEEFIYHLKAKQYDIFEDWVEQLKRHRLYRQHLLNFGASVPSKDVGPNKLPLSRKLASDGGSPPLRLQWVMDSGPLQVAVTELNHTQQALSQLGRILEQLELSSTEPENANDGFSPNVKKDRKKFGLRKKKSNKGSSVDLTVTTKDVENNLTAQIMSSPTPIRPSSLTTEHHIPYSSSGLLDINLASDFVVLAKDVYTSLKSITYTIHTEKDRFKGSPDDRIKSALAVALKQNNELRTRLGSISRTSDIADLPEPFTLNHFQEVWDFQTRILHSSLSRNSCASEFYDAEEGDASDLPETGATSDASSIAGSSEEGGSESSEVSDMADSEYNITQDTQDSSGYRSNNTNLTGRRNKLPAPSPDSQGLSLWQLLSKNIGKDLSQVSMPVGLSHPLSVLQRLCEDLEYSELLDKAASLSDPVERMVHVAAFAISSYSSSYLRASKPFNPLLGETYEAVREDRGFRFISEQVSHHPPISVCHAESKNYTFWQEFRIKTKFWGKSMEFQPSGILCLELERPDGGKRDSYKWNKVTACVHNLFSDNRWVEQYGTMTIENKNHNCIVEFIRASYFSPQRYELHAKIIENAQKKEVQKLFGRWNEALYVGENVPSARCVWRPGTMPPDYNLYYGFTRFAIELNELQPDMINVLPCTDTRFRPDQRLLEEGKIEDAERVKLQLEQSQRERRKKLESEGQVYEPRWFRKTTNEDKEEIWQYKGNYWDLRKNPGFVNLKIEPIW